MPQFLSRHVPLGERPLIGLRLDEPGYLAEGFGVGSHIVVLDQEGHALADIPKYGLGCAYRLGFKCRWVGGLLIVVVVENVEGEQALAAVLRPVSAVRSATAYDQQCLAYTKRNACYIPGIS